MRKYFENKTIWITGASSGIGEGFTNQLSGIDCQLIISARRKQELDRVKANNDSKLAKIDCRPLDLIDAGKIQKTAQEVLKKYGSVDMVIHCGGISQRSYALDTDMSVIRNLMEINFMGTVQLSHELMPSMVQNKCGHHVVISSVIGKIGIPARTGYAASKHALHGYFDSLRAEHYEDNIDITVFCPGYIHTNLSKNALLGDGTKNEVTDNNIAGGMSVDEFVSKALKKISVRKKEVYIGRFREILGIYVMRFFPNLFFKIARGLKEG